MDEILKLTEEKSTWLFLADGLTQEHQQSIRLDLLRKADNIQCQIDELKRAQAKTSDENAVLPIHSVVNSVCPTCNSKLEETEGHYTHFCEHCNKNY